MLTEQMREAWRECILQQREVTYLGTFETALVRLRYRFNILIKRIGEAVIND
jgi:hypothetical protein